MTTVKGVEKEKAQKEEMENEQKEDEKKELNQMAVKGDSNCKGSIKSRTPPFPREVKKVGDESKRRARNRKS